MTRWRVGAGFAARKREKKYFSSFTLRCCYCVFWSQVAADADHPSQSIPTTTTKGKNEDEGRERERKTSRDKPFYKQRSVPFRERVVIEATD